MNQTDELTFKLIELLYSDKPVCPIAAKWEMDSLLRQKNNCWWRNDYLIGCEDADRGIKRHLGELLYWNCLLAYEKRVDFVSKFKDRALIEDNRLSPAHLRLWRIADIPKSTKSLQQAFNQLNRPELVIAFVEVLASAKGCESDCRELLKKAYKEAAEEFVSSNEPEAVKVRQTAKALRDRMSPVVAELL